MNDQHNPSISSGSKEMRAQLTKELNVMDLLVGDVRKFKLEALPDALETVGNVIGTLLASAADKPDDALFHALEIVRQAALARISLTKLAQHGLVPGAEAICATEARRRLSEGGVQ